MRPLRAILNFISSVFVVIVVVLAVLLAGVRLVGLTPYTVLSGSMEPAYHVGSLIYVQKADPAEIQVGDAITFVVNEDLLVATHRVVDIEIRTTKFTESLDAETGEPILDEEGNATYIEVPMDEPSYYYTTKGDANEAVDGSAVWHKNVIGKPVFTVPYLGYLSSYLQTREGTIVGVTAGLVVIILSFLPDLLRSAEEADARSTRRRRKRRRKRKAQRKNDHR